MRQILLAGALLGVMGALAGCSNVSRSLRPDGFEIISFTHDSTNAILVRRGSTGFLFDSGYEKNAALLEADLRSVQFDPAGLKAIIVSHGHADHAGGAQVLHKKFGTPVIVGTGDEGMFLSGRNEPLCPVGFIAGTRKNKDQSATYTGSQPDVVLRETTDLNGLTGLPGRIVLLPGHTRGSLVVAISDVLLVGDLLRGSIVGSGAETHFFMCDLAQNQRNIATLLTTYPDAKMLYVGHFGPVSPAAVRDHFHLTP